MHGFGLPRALLSPIINASKDAGGLGWLLPFFLGATLAGGLAVAVARARTNRTQIHP